MTVNPLEERQAGSVSYYLQDELGESRAEAGQAGEVIIVISGDDSLRSQMSLAGIKLSDRAQQRNIWTEPTSFRALYYEQPV